MYITIRRPSPALTVFNYPPTPRRSSSDAAYSGAAGTLLGVAPNTGLSADSGALKDVVLPNVFIGFRVSDALSVGVGVNAPFGSEFDLLVEFRGNRYHAIETDLKAISFNAAAALELSPRLSVGGVLRVQRLDFNVSNAIDSAGILTANSIAGFVPGTDDAFVDA